ncbi:MAG: ribosomal protection-like ABC-F family protein [Christensenellales bacterium]
MLTANGIKKSFGAHTLFEDISFEIEAGDRVGLVGVNGCGKTTLMRILEGGMEPDSGNIFFAQGTSVGFMQQHVPETELPLLGYALKSFDEVMQTERELERINERINSGEQHLVVRQHALMEKFEAGGGYTYLSRTKAALKGVGFSDQELELPVNALSGGQKSKLLLVSALLSGANLLLLDEPTNHLDIASAEWLEQYLNGFKGAFIVISHDRYFLDRVTSRTMEIENGKLECYGGAYTVAMQKKRELKEAELKRYKNVMREAERLEGIIEKQRQWNREKSIKKAESTQKQLNRLLETVSPPKKSPEGIKIKLGIGKPSGKDVLSVDGVYKHFPDMTLFENISFNIKRGDRAFIAGPNGCGKTTLIKLLYAGGDGVKWGSGISIGYYDQEQSGLYKEGTALENITALGITDGEARGALAMFGIKGVDVFKKASSMSGGERARIELLRLILCGANILILDEPTNHLDIMSREALENALEEYEGTMLAVSHDRYFINRFANRIIELKKDGAQEYAGNYDDYVAKRVVEEPEKGGERVKKISGYQLQKELSQAVRMLEGSIRRLEEAIAEKEQEAEKKRSLMYGESDYEKLMQLQAEADAIDAETDCMYEEWEEKMAKKEEASLRLLSQKEGTGDAGEYC